MRTLEHRLLHVAAVAVVGWSAVIAAPTGVSAAVVTVPVGLPPGSQYRLGFVTNTNTLATSADIAVYNTFVTAAANTEPDLVAEESRFIVRLWKEKRGD